MYQHDRQDAGVGYGPLAQIFEAQVHERNEQTDNLEYSSKQRSFKVHPRTSPSRADATALTPKPAPIAAVAPPALA